MYLIECNELFSQDIDSFCKKVFRKPGMKIGIVKKETEKKENIGMDKKEQNETEMKENYQEAKKKAIALGRVAFYKAAKDQKLFVQSFLQFVVKARLKLDISQQDFIDL